MDLQFLHVMQAFREGDGAFLRDFFYQITTLADKEVIPILMALIYWCVSKRFGTYILMGFHWNRLVNGFSKITACVYRPWIRDPTLIPDQGSLAGATGYSFPSGHSMNAASVFGGIGVSAEMKRGLRIASWVMVALIAFSRLYMCVHTPQDVLTGVVLGSIVMYVAYRLYPIIEGKKYGDLIAAGISVAISILIAIYAANKSYPVDYDESGKILVDGSKMAVDTFKVVGWNCGFFVGWILERRFVKFTSDGSIQDRCLRMICGILLYYFVNYSILPLVKSAIGGNLGAMASCFLQMLFVVLLYPICIKLFEGRRKAA